MNVMRLDDWYRRLVLTGGTAVPTMREARCDYARIVEAQQTHGAI